MVFSSVPVYLDPPNWQQQPNQHHQANGSDSPQLLLQAEAPHVGGGVGSIRPGTMADRAHLAKIPPQEAALKCPRCESTNTKFCYYNNYNLSQPRHFCKTCRRYWTRGGSLRNVPVGGGCRKNKKNKRSSSKSPASSDKHSLSNSISAVPSGCTPELIGRISQPTNRPNFMGSIQNLRSYGVGNIGLSLREIQGQNEHVGFQIGGHSSTAGGGLEQWRFQQFPFVNGIESTSAVSYPFQRESVEAPSFLVGLGDMAAASRVSQLPPIKLEDNGGLNLSRSHQSVSENNQYYSWTDLSGHIL